MLWTWSKKELIEKQAPFWPVIASGSTLQAACDAAGVDRRTGRRWRQATGGQVPRKKPEPSGRYLSVEERLQIADLRVAGAGVRAIATEAGEQEEHAMEATLTAEGDQTVLATEERGVPWTSSPPTGPGCRSTPKTSASQSSPFQPAGCRAAR